MRWISVGRGFSGSTSTTWTTASSRLFEGPGIPNDSVLVVANFTPVVRKGYLVGVPEPGFYRELLNSDSARYGGSNTINFDGVSSEPTPCQGQPHLIMLTLPPLGVIFLKREETA